MVAELKAPRTLMASLGDDGDFTGQVTLPYLTSLADNELTDWEEQSWNFKAYLAMFDST